MTPEEQNELLYRMDESMKYMKNDILEIKEVVKAFSEKVSSLESTIIEHRQFMIQHPVMCSQIEELERSVSKDRILNSSYLNIISTGGAIVNGAILLYLSYVGVFGK